MRLRLRIERHSLPPTLLLWAVKDPSCLISELFQQINCIVPLETDDWGPEDYVFVVGGYEVVHYAVVEEALKDEDMVTVKPLKRKDLRIRAMTGRDQITPDGRHLVDGIPYGRPNLREPTRPIVRIPPRKRQRLMGEEEAVREEEEAVLARQLVITGQLGEEDDDEEDDDDFELEAAGMHPLSSDASDDVSSSEDERSSDSAGYDEDDQTSSSSNESSSDSESDSSESSPESEEEQPWEGLPDDLRVAQDAQLKAALDEANVRAMTNRRVRTDENDGQEDNAASTPQQGSGSLPFEGLAKTHSRNVRRRDARKLKHLKATGVVPQNWTLEQMREWHGNHHDAEANENSLAGGEEAKVNEAGNAMGDAPTNNALGGDDYAQVVVTGNINGAAHPERTTAKSQKRPAAKVPHSQTIDFEQRRQQLINDIASGGVEVSDTNVGRAAFNGVDGAEDDLDNSLPEEITSKAPETGKRDRSTTLEVGSPAMAAKRRKLDLAGSQRLVFGSLGVRVPRTQEDKDQLQKKLAAGSKQKARRDPATFENPNGVAQDSLATNLNANGAQPTPVADDNSEGWRNKINLTAVETVDEGVTLSEPPFPFRQGWDPQYNRKSKMRTSTTYQTNGGRVKKCKKDSRQPAAETYDKYNTDGYGDALNYDEEDGEEEEYWEDGALLNGTSDSEVDEDDDDLPSLPVDITTLPTLHSAESQIGDIITFTELACDASTNWQPKSVTRTAKILEKPDMDDDNFAIQLANRDVHAPKYDEDGNRIYSKFEMPEDERENGQDGRMRDVCFAGLGEVRIVQKAR